MKKRALFLLEKKALFMGYIKCYQRNILTSLHDLFVVFALCFKITLILTWSDAVGGLEAFAEVAGVIHTHHVSNLCDIVTIVFQ